MSRIGNKSIDLPDKVKINVGNGGLVNVEGPKGKLNYTLPRTITAKSEAGKFTLARPDDERANKALHGLARSLVANMVTGVSTGYVKDLEIQGVGFKAAVQGDKLNLSLGKSHPILFPIPAGIKITVTDNTKVKVEGIDKQVVGQVAANIRGYYPPEPYKGKGVRQ
jgi:large subunit ribosomal protein L6